MDEVVLEGIVGSRAYGLDTDDSDTDRLGVFVAPVEKVLGLRWVSGNETAVSRDPDRTWHEIAKYLRLALAANPTVLELLWLSSWEVCEPLGEALVEIRRSFLSERVRATYGGYARQQMQRLLNRGDTFSSSTAERTAKHGRHLRRLLFQLESVLTTTDIQVRLEPGQRDACFWAGEMAGNDPQKLAEWFDEELSRLDGLASRLPERPDETAAEALLLRARLGGGV